MNHELLSDEELTAGVHFLVAYQALMAGILMTRSMYAIISG